MAEARGTRPDQPSARRQPQNPVEWLMALLGLGGFGPVPGAADYAGATPFDPYYGYGDRATGYGSPGGPLSAGGPTTRGYAPPGTPGTSSTPYSGGAGMPWDPATSWDSYLPPPGFFGGIAGGPAGVYAGTEGGYYGGTVMPGRAPRPDLAAIGNVGGMVGAQGQPKAPRPNPTDLRTLLDATSYDILDLQTQVREAEKAIQANPNDFAARERGMQAQARLEAARGTQGYLILQLEQQGERGVIRDWEKTYQTATLNWQIHHGTAQQRQAAEHFAQTMGLNRDQLAQADAHFQAGRADTFKKLGIEQDFIRSEKVLDRSHQTEQAAAQRGFVREEREASQQHQTGERRDQNQFLAGQSELGRGHEVRLELMREEFNKVENQMGREIQMKIAQMNDAVARGQLDLARANSEFDRWAKTRQLELQGQAEENAEKRFQQTFGQTERHFGQTMGFNVAKTEVEENREKQRFGQAERQFGAKLGEDQRQFNESFGQGRKRDAMTQLASLIQQGFATGGPEVQVGGGPGGSIGQIMAAFGGDPAATQQTYYKPAAPDAALSQIQADLAAAPLTSTPYQAAEYQGSNALDEFRKRVLGG